MGARRKLSALTSAFLAVSLILGPVLPAAAQEEAPAPGVADPPAPGEADPPARVGRVARVSGTVSFHPAGGEQWEPAQINWPVTSGSAFWTEPGGSAELELPSGRILLAAGSEFDVDRLDARQLTATVRQGDVYIRPSSLAPEESYRLQTPRGVVTIATAGRYEIVVGDTGQPTRVTVYQGAAQIGEGSAALQAVAGQSIVISGNEAFPMRVEPAGPDRFQARLAPPVARRKQAVAPPAAVAEMPGGADLVQYGSWEPNQEYGPVWYPQVSPGWVPYRSGHWGYVAPWGWTWIDAAPWGFAPFHYGRWFQSGGRWAWTPGGYVAAGGPVYAPPVYAPALVTFFGAGVGVGVGVGIAAGLAGPVGWCPLGPREAYHPWYRASPAYVRNVNYAHLTGGENTGRGGGNVQDFRNVRAATQVPAGVMVASRPVGPAARTLRPAFAELRPLAGQAPVQPNVATAGVTPGLARSLNIASPVNQPIPPARRPAPGPAIQAQGRPLQPVAAAAPRPGPGTVSGPAAGPAAGLAPKPAQPAGAPMPSLSGGWAEFSRPVPVPPQGGQRPAGMVTPAAGVARPIPPGAPGGGGPGAVSHAAMPVVPQPGSVAPMVAPPAGARPPMAAQPSIVQPSIVRPGRPMPAGVPGMANPQQEGVRHPPSERAMQAAPPIQPQAQPRFQPPAQAQVQPHFQPPPQAQVQPRFQPPAQAQVQPHVQPPAQAQAQPRFQPPSQAPVQPRFQPPPQMQAQPHFQPPPQAPVQPRFQPPPQAAVQQTHAPAPHAPPPSSSRQGKRPGEP